MHDHFVPMMIIVVMMIIVAQIEKVYHSCVRTFAGSTSLSIWELECVHLKDREKWKIMGHNDHHGDKIIMH